MRATWREKYRNLGLILLGTVLLSITYGIAHDLITARVCIEYFTEFHPRIIDSVDPVALALLWGVIATWWFGAIAGAAIGAVATWGHKPVISPGRTLVLIGKAMVSVFALAMLTLCLLTRVGPYLPVDMVLPYHKGGQQFGARLFAVGATHMVSYFGNAIAAGIVAIIVYRIRLRSEPPMPHRSQ